MTLQDYILYCIATIVILFAITSCNPNIPDLSKPGSNPSATGVGYLTLRCREKDTKCTDNLKDVCRNAVLLEEVTEEGTTVRKYRCGTP